MTNYERLLDLPLREVLKEFANPTEKFVADAFSYFSDCYNSKVEFCKLCDEISTSCSGVCLAWFNKESAPDANYNDDVWHDTSVEVPGCSDTTEDYIVLIDGASKPTLLAFDGEFWLDDDANSYNVTHWRPLPELPVERSAE